MMTSATTQLSSTPGWVGPSDWSMHSTQRGGIGPGVCRKEGVCLERIHTLKQQVFRISPQEMRLGTTNLKTGGSSQNIFLDFCFVYF